MVGFNSSRARLVSGRKGKKGDSGGKESPNTLRSKATARLLDLLGEGEIKGLVNGAKSIYLDETPLMSQSGDYNFKGVSWDIRVGLPDQSVIPGAKGVDAITNVGVEVKYGVPITRALSDPDYNSCVVTIRIPTLSKADDKGNIKPTTVSFRIDIRYQGGPWSTTTGDVTLTGKCVSPYDKQFYFVLPKNPSGASAPWEIRVTRLTEDSDSIKLQNQTVFSSIQGSIEAKFSYPYSALVGMVIDAEQFNGSIPSRAYEVYGRIIQVPSNYTTRLYDANGNITRNSSYSGGWDGTFKWEWTNNPAWIFYDLIVNNRFGLGEFIDPSQVDKWGLYTIAKYCDEMVPNGYGGMEPRMTFNGVISQKREAYDALATMASCFRGMAYWSSGSIMVAQDAPKDPTVLANPSNVIGGVFDRNSSALKARHTVCMVAFNDPRDFYKTNYEVYQNEDGILKYGYRETRIDATGCTSRGQAHRMAKWTVLTELYEKATITYQAGSDHAGVRPGDIVAINDPSQAGAEYGGRLREDCTDTILSLDLPIVFEAPNEYWVSVQMPDGSVEERPIEISAYGAETYQVTLATPLSTAPDPQSMWIVSKTGLEPELFRVITIKESEPHIYDVMGLQYEPSKFDAVDIDAAFELIDTSDIPTGDLVPPTAATFEEYPMSVANIGTVFAVDWSVTPSKDPRIAQYEWWMQSIEEDGTTSAWTMVDTTYDPLVTIQSLEPGYYNFRVRATGALTGTVSAYLTSMSVNILGSNLPPTNVDAFRVNILGEMASLSWTVPTTLNVAHYELRYTPLTENVQWSAATILVEQVSGFGIQVPALKGTYLIKAVSYTGVYSPIAKMVVNDTENIAAMNAVQEYNEHPTFLGTKTDTEVVLEGLQLVETDNTFPPEGTYNFQNTLDLGGIYTSRLTANIDVFGRDTRNTMSSWGLLSGLEAMSSVGSDLWDLALEYRVSNQASTDPLIVWSDWETFIIGDVTFRSIQFRVRLFSLNSAVTPVIRSLSVKIDMPDRIISNKDVLVPTAGLAIAFDPPFKHLTGIAIADQDMATGDRKVITAKSETGFAIRYFNSSGTAVARTFDYTAVGYGVQQ
ncbi:tail host specificity protein J [Rhizobium phage RHph_I4]|nr:tail host specificity protein J [Rhizobium phage RHph_I4]